MVPTRLISVTATAAVLVIGLAGCSRHDQQQVKEEAREAGREIKQDAKELGHKVDNSLGGGSAQDKMARVDAKLDRATLVGRVKSKLAADAGLSTLADVEVVVNGGIVTLTGTAASEEQRKSAELAAASVDGVTRVRNHIVVRPR